MSSSMFIVPRGVVSERVGGELMVVVPGRTEVVTLTGDAADVFLDVQAGKTPHASEKLMNDLEGLGLVQITGVSRRGLIKASAIGASAGIAVMAMPGVAAAASEPTPQVIELIGSFMSNTLLIVYADDNVVMPPIRETVDPHPTLIVEDYDGDVWNGFLTFDGNNVLSSAAWDVFPAITQTVVGTFTFDNVLYRVTFIRP